MTKDPIGIIGYGKLGKASKLLAIDCGWKNNFIYFDDNCVDLKIVNSFPFQDFQKEQFKHVNFVVGIGYKNLNLRREILNHLSEKQRAIPSLVHPTAFVHTSATLGSGVYIYPMCNVDHNVELKNGVILHNSSIVAHDSVIREASFLSSGVTISGFCNIGPCTFIGAGSAVSNNISIGQQVTVGIGTVVTKDLVSRKFYIGNPIREVSSICLQ